jgi:hypothetical protein
MDPVHMAERCPGAIARGPALLRGYALHIAAKGYGTVLPALDGVIYGVLWELQPADVAALDIYEGVPEGLYRQDSVTVEPVDGGERRAMLYRATDAAPGSAVPGYLERIIEVAEALEFPRSYLAELRELQDRARRWSEEHTL